jgi:hypothetical protein
MNRMVDPRRQRALADVAKARKFRDDARERELESIRMAEKEAAEWRYFWEDSARSWREIGDFWNGQAACIAAELRRKRPITMALEARVSPAVHAVDFDRVED